MTTNQLPGDMARFSGAAQMGLRAAGFGYGVSVALHPARSSSRDPSPLPNPLGCGEGEYGWGGAAATQYFASPRDGGILVLVFTQVLRDPGMVADRRELRKLVYAAVREQMHGREPGT